MRQLYFLAAIICFGGCSDEPNDQSTLQDNEIENKPETEIQPELSTPQYTPIYRKCLINGAQVDLIQNRNNLLQYLNKNSVIAPSGNLEHLTTVYRTTQSKADGTLFFKETSEHGEFAAVMLIKKMTAVVEFNIQEAQQNPFVTVTYGELAKAAWACTSGNNTPLAFKNCNGWIGRAFGQSSSEASQETVLLNTRVTVTRNGPKMTITFTAVKK